MSVDNFRSIEFTRILLRFGFKEHHTTRAQRITRWTSPSNEFIILVQGTKVEIFQQKEDKRAPDSAFTLNRQDSLLDRLREVLIEEVINV